MKKTLKLSTFLLLFVATIFASNVNAQETATVYYFGYAYSYETDEPVMIISNVKSTECETGYRWYSPSNANGQWMDYMMAEYKDSYKFEKSSFMVRSAKDAETERRRVMGRWEYKIIKIDDFVYYCD